MINLTPINDSMKIPRDILLTRHRAAEPKLDRIRADVLEKLASKSRANSVHSERPQVEGIWSRWRFVIQLLAARRLNAVGLGCVWLVILAFRLATPASSIGNFARSPASRPAMQAAMMEQQRLLAELNDFPESRVRKEAPKSDATRPRSERRHPHASV